MSPRLAVREYASAIVEKVLKDTPKAVTSAQNVKVTMSLVRNASPPSGLFVRPRPLGGEMVAPPAVTTKSAVGSPRWYATPFTKAPLRMRVPDPNSSQPSVVDAVPAIAALNASLLFKTMKSALASVVGLRANKLRVTNRVAARCRFSMVPLSFVLHPRFHRLLASEPLYTRATFSGSPLTGRAAAGFGGLVMRGVGSRPSRLR